MHEIRYRTLDDHEVQAARDLSNRNPDVFGVYLKERLPCFFDILHFCEPESVFSAKQRLKLGAFHGNQLAGVVFASPVDRTLDAESGSVSWEQAVEEFSEHDMYVYSTLLGDWNQCLLSAPEGTLLLHSLCVSHEYRGRGIAQGLVSHSIDQLDDEERASLYIQVARFRGHVKFCKSLGFEAVRKRFSFSDRLQFGCWGTVLLRFAPTG